MRKLSLMTQRVKTMMVSRLPRVLASLTQVSDIQAINQLRHKAYQLPKSHQDLLQSDNP